MSAASGAAATEDTPAAVAVEAEEEVAAESTAPATEEEPTGLQPSSGRWHGTRSGFFPTPLPSQQSAEAVRLLRGGCCAARRGDVGGAELSLQQALDLALDIDDLEVAGAARYRLGQQVSSHSTSRVTQF